jgi:glycosyltransferase involved in cell wall biosynthesis
MISVVIPFRNARRHLTTIANALKRQTLDQSAFEVIWIDDGSKDGSNLWLQERLAPGWRLLLHSEPRGSYAARNTGLRAVMSENVAFTDVDCRPDDDWLERGLAALGSSARVGGRIHLEVSDRPSTAELVDAGRFLRQHRYVEEGFAATANLFVRRNVFDLVGNFDERLQSGGDHEFGWRCSQAGVSIEYAENAVVHHPARASLGQLLRKAERVGFGAGQVARRRRMPIRELAQSAFDRLALVRSRGAGERTARGDGLRRSFLVTAVYMLVTVATALGCLRGLLGSGAAASPDRNDCRQNRAA